MSFFYIAPARLVLFQFRLLVLLSRAGADPWGLPRGQLADSGFSLNFLYLRRRRPGSRPGARARLAIGGGVCYAHFWLITGASSGCAARCVRGLLRWRVLVALIKETGVFVRLPSRLRLSRDARHRRPPPTPATDARQKTQPEPGPAGDARGRSRMPLKTPTAHRGRICRETPPSCGVLERSPVRIALFWYSTRRGG